MVNVITGKSKVYGIFGDPVAHSLSPVMQNAAFAHFQLDAVYVPFRVSPDDLPAAVTSLRALNIAGVNVTIPHKEAIIKLLDRLDPLAEQIGAVNTVVNYDGVLTGYNTDASGFLRSAQQELGFDPHGKKALLLGAGGACRAAVAALMSAEIGSVVVANRTLARARNLVSAFAGGTHGISLQGIDYHGPEFEQAVAEADLIVNTTALGLQGESLEFLSLEQVKPSASLYDMVYSLSGTPLVGAARAAGITCVDGFVLLAAQGEDAFYLWTKKPCPQQFMQHKLSEFTRQITQENRKV